MTAVRSQSQSDLLTLMARYIKSPSEAAFCSLMVEIEKDESKAHEILHQLRKQVEAESKDFVPDMSYALSFYLRGLLHENGRIRDLAAAENCYFLAKRYGCKEAVKRLDPVLQNRIEQQKRFKKLTKEAVQGSVEAREALALQYAYNDDNPNIYMLAVEDRMIIASRYLRDAHEQGSKNAQQYLMRIFEMHPNFLHVVYQAALVFNDSRAISQLNNYARRLPHLIAFLIQENQDDSEKVLGLLEVETAENVRQLLREPALYDFVNAKELVEIKRSYQFVNQVVKFEQIKKGIVKEIIKSIPADSLSMLDKNSVESCDSLEKESKISVPDVDQSTVDKMLKFNIKAPNEFVPLHNLETHSIFYFKPSALLLLTGEAKRQQKKTLGR